MSGVRIDVGAVWSASDLIGFNYGGAGDVSLTLRTAHAGGSYALQEAALNASEIAQRIRDVLYYQNSPSTNAMSCTESNGVYTVASSGSTFNLTLGNSSLQNLTGLPASTTGASSVSSSSASPGVFVGNRPAIVTAGARWHTRRTEIHRGKGRSFKILKRKIWRVDLLIEQSEISSWRSVARYILQGQPFSIFQDTSVIPGDTWGYTAPNKNIKGAVLDRGIKGFVESQLTEPYQSEIAVSFTCTEDAP